MTAGVDSVPARVYRAKKYGNNEVPTLLKQYHPSPRSNLLLSQETIDSIASCLSPACESIFATLSTVDSSLVLSGSYLYGFESTIYARNSSLFRFARLRLKDVISLVKHAAKRSVLAASPETTLTTLNQ